jgi:DNA (cytosine-5)-methyltransferase 1
MSLRTGGGGGETKANLVATSLAVRRLMPVECERLMGWPDDHTRYGDGGREMKDGPRYRMIGNGVAAPVAEWIGRRLVRAAR